MTRFNECIEATLSAIENSIDRASDEHDIDCARSGNVLTLTFENGQRIVVNSQEANEELWLAARSGGFHYRWDESSGRWIDTRSGDELRATLSRLVEGEVGAVVAVDV